MAKQLVLPRIHVIILCDGVEPTGDEDTVCHLFGIRTTIRAEAFPHIHPELYVYLQMTGHAGIASGTLLLVQSGTNGVLRRKALPALAFFGPLEMISLHLCLRNCEFPEPGLYYIQINFDGKLLGERFIEVIDTTGAEQ